MEKETTTRDRVKVWKESFKEVLRNKKGYSRRLNELQTWDKPLNPKSNDPGGKWPEWAKKVQALEELLGE